MKCDEDDQVMVERQLIVRSECDRSILVVLIRKYHKLFVLVYYTHTLYVRLYVR